MPLQHQNIKNRLESIFALIKRNAFINSEEPGMILGHSIPSSKTLYKFLNVINFPAHPKILQIGTGQGYASAILSRLAKQVIAIEKDPSLTIIAKHNLQRMRHTNIEIREGDGSLGASDEAPFSVIVVNTATIKDITPLLNQLTPYGQLVCIESGVTSLMLLVKYTNDGHQNFIRSEHGYLNFSHGQDDILIDLGLITNEVLENAKINAKINKTPIIDEVRLLINLNELDLYRSLAKEYKLELGKLEKLLPETNSNLFGKCSKAFLDLHRLIPISISNKILRVATNDPDASLIEIEKVFPHLTAEKILVTPTDFHRLWRAIDLSIQTQYDDSPFYLESTNQDIEPEKKKPELEAHLITIFEALLLDAVAEHASDIHLEIYNNDVRVRLRIDGELIDLGHYRINPQELRGLINVIKIRSELDIAERRLPQGGRSRLRVGKDNFDLRIQIQPSLYGEHVVIRLLPQNSQMIGIEELGLSREVADNYRRMLHNPAGLLLVVGPTGSGKSTTLYSGLQLLAADGRRKVITVEDPIEYSIDNIQQTQVHPEIGFNFADAMRSFVRQDPDVIMVGEIRDHETALEAIRASQTGHLLLSTMHCNDAVDAMQRLYDLGVHPNSLASELLAVMAQRLAKKICSHCREVSEPEPEILSELFPDGTPANFKTYYGKGCDQCNDNGTKGRVAVVEYLKVNADMRNAISRQLPVGELRKLALDCGLITMRDSALDHVIQGNIPLSELPRILPAERMAPESRSG